MNLGTQERSYLLVDAKNYLSEVGLPESQAMKASSLKCSLKLVEKLTMLSGGKDAGSYLKLFAQAEICQKLAKYCPGTFLRSSKSGQPPLSRSLRDELMVAAE
nr:unnamed protein product [Callosobruchus chinensis]